MNRIIEIGEIVPNVHRLVLDAPEIARKVKPGQFVILMVDEVGERVPFTVSDWDPAGGTVTIYFLELGISTMKLARKKSGGVVHALIGPLGRPAAIDNYGKVFLAGGCYGIGGVYPIARALKEAGNEVVTAIEARSKYLLYNQDALRAVSDELVESTTDGTAGVKGKVTGVLEKFRSEGRKFDMYYFIGCPFMMMNGSMKAPDDAKTFVALTAIMVDGTGMCGCCRVSVGGATKFACVDGPEFDGKQVDWDQVGQRNAIYSREEMLAYHQHTCRVVPKGVGD